MGPVPGGLLHPPWTHSGTNSLIRELEHTMCLPDRSAEDESYFPKSGGASWPGPPG